jgi:signal transduction histidine kinase
VFSVTDTGPGIPSQELSRVFERFYRTDQSRSRESGGTGLGLSIAHWIAQRHQGSLEVLSREGVGSRFSLVLPLETAE